MNTLFDIQGTVNCVIHYFYTMKILRFVLVASGLVLICFGIYSFFYPTALSQIDQIQGVRSEGLTDQTAGMLGIGLMAILAGIFMKNRR